MIKRHSFRIDDAEGMNALLASTNIVPAAGLAVSEGWVNFAVEDGEIDSNLQLSLQHKKLLGEELMKKELMDHNVRVAKLNIDKLEQHRSKKEIVENKKEWEACLKQMENFKNVLLFNESESMRLQIEIDIRQARINELEGAK